MLLIATVKFFLTQRNYLSGYLMIEKTTMATSKFADKSSHLKVLSSSKQIMFHMETRQTFSRTIQGEKVIQT